MGLASQNNRLKTVKEKFSILRNDILDYNSSRSQRTVFDGGGEAMNRLFRITTVQQLKTLDAKFRKRTEHTGEVAHLLQQHASLINESLWEIRTTAPKRHQQTKYGIGLLHGR